MEKCRLQMTKLVTKLYLWEIYMDTHILFFFFKYMHIYIILLKAAIFPNI